ncbi:MAG: hypothetical protein HY973_02590 [Candidatus Kerfeldbacteria bacterium]|nr:hypothetical protein [Candidatus Kerfeldbacteria bacterium]
MNLIKQLVNYKEWKYRNSFWLVVTLLLLWLITRTDWFGYFLNQLTTLGYLGIFMAGVFFISTFTVAPAAVILFHLGQNLNPYLAAVIAGLGAMMGDYFVFRYFKDRVFYELTPFLMRLGGDRLKKLLSLPYFGWLSFVLGALIIASPFPDEVGLGLMGLSHIKTNLFLLLTLVLNSLGILVIILISQAV